MKAREIALSGVMTALVFVVTRTFALPIPQTKGFFNLGEAGVYASALLFGPLVGALSGGVGSALADLSLGYAQYAPFTLVIKGLEGAVVGLVARTVSPGVWRFGLGAGAIAAVVLLTAEAFAVRVAAAVLLGVAAGGLLLLRSQGGSRIAARVFGMMAGGLIMVVGYFVTQAYLLGLGVLPALVEVPYNLVQVSVGTVAGLAASVAFDRALPVRPR
ncbi:MAG: ECF transporter S component [bacterium]|nr:ECF transporter S component [bacterium]